MPVNKVIFGNVILIDTSEVTVTPETLGAGVTALNAAGEQIEGTAEIVPHPVLSDDLIPTAIDTDGTIYNGTGYMDGYRIGSGGTISASSNFMHTGFIPFRFDECLWAFPESASTSRLYMPEYIHFYDKDFVHLGYTVCANAKNSWMVSLDRSINEKPINFVISGKNIENTAYIRVSGNVSFGKYTLHKAIK